MLLAPPALRAQIGRIDPSLEKQVELIPGKREVVGGKVSPYVFVSEHYRVESDLSLACSTWAGQFLESCWPKLRKRFGLSAKPTHDRKKFFVYIHERREDLEVAIKLESPDLNSHENHGYYSFKTGNLRVWFDPLPTHFRRLLLHEAAHQFHYSSLGPGRGQFRRSPHWYIEGVAHELERHEADGRSLKLGLADSCYFPEFSFEALEIVKARRFRLDNFLRGRRSSVPKEQLESRALGWSVVRFFRHGASRKEKEWFKNFERNLSGGGGVPARTRRRGNDEVDRIEHQKVRERLITFLEKDVERAASKPRGEWVKPSKNTFKSHYTGGWFNVLPLAKIYAHSKFSASFVMPRKPQPNEGVGFLIGYHNKKSYLVVQVTGNGKQLYVVSRDGDKFVAPEVHDLEENLRGKKLHVGFLGKDTLSINVGEKQIATRSIPQVQRSGYIALFAEDRSKPTMFGPFHPQHYTFMNVDIRSK
ncbi:MAG: hypothetical protein ACI97A_003191 [Planctomycetota bacterium]|jgi:hypothetical protein